MAEGSKKKQKLDSDSSDQDNPDPTSSNDPEPNTSISGITEDEAHQIWFNPTWRSHLLKPRHIDFCRRLLFKSLPSPYEEYDTQRINFLHFSVASLDLLQAIDTVTKDERQRIINWIYRLQITSGPPENYGFRGSTTFITVPKLYTGMGRNDCMFASHVTMTFAALVTLLTLGDDLSGVDRPNVLRGVQSLQNTDGSFKASQGCDESDMRFVYSAIAICYILDDFSLINIPSLLDYVRGSFTFEGSFGSGNGTEGHAAYTFCAVATLFLLDKLNDTITYDELRTLTRWCIFRQKRGFTGRPNKDEDTCYSFWVGATLEILKSLNLTGREENIDWILSNQNPLTGGIGKCDNDFTDPLHTFMGIAGLSLVKYDDLNPIHPALTMSQNSVNHLHRLHRSWATESAAC